MSYISNSDIQTRLGSSVYTQLTDDTGSGSPSEAVVDEARLGAEGEVNAYLARRYDVPIDLAAHPELSDVLKSVSLDLAEHRLRLRRPPVSAESSSRREAALEWLKAVASGAANLPAASDPDPSPLGGFDSQVTGEDRLLSRDEMTDF